MADIHMELKTKLILMILFVYSAITIFSINNIAKAIEISPYDIIRDNFTNEPRNVVLPAVGGVRSSADKLYKVIEDPTDFDNTVLSFTLSQTATSVDYPSIRYMNIGAVTINDTTTVGISGKVVVEARIMLGSASAKRTLFALGNQDANAQVGSFRTLIFDSDGKLKAYGVDGDLLGGNSYQTNHWYRIQMVLNLDGDTSDTGVEDTDTYDIYIDGILCGSNISINNGRQSWMTPTNSLGLLKSVGSENFIAVGTEPYQDYIDDLRIYRLTVPDVVVSNPANNTVAVSPEVGVCSIQFNTSMDKDTLTTSNIQLMTDTNQLVNDYYIVPIYDSEYYIINGCKLILPQLSENIGYKIVLGTGIKAEGGMTSLGVEKIIHFTTGALKILSADFSTDPISTTTQISDITNIRIKTYKSNVTSWNVVADPQDENNKVVSFGLLSIPTAVTYPSLSYLNVGAINSGDATTLGVSGKVVLEGRVMLANTSARRYFFELGNQNGSTGLAAFRTICFDNDGKLKAGLTYDFSQYIDLLDGEAYQTNHWYIIKLILSLDGNISNTGAQDNDTYDVYVDGVLRASKISISNGKTGSPNSLGILKSVKFDEYILTKPYVAFNPLPYKDYIDDINIKLIGSTAPKVRSSIPANNEINVPADIGKMTIRFNIGMDITTLTTSNIQLKTADGNIVAGYSILPIADAANGGDYNSCTILLPTLTENTKYIVLLSSQLRSGYGGVSANLAKEISFTTGARSLYVQSTKFLDLNENDINSINDIQATSTGLKGVKGSVVILNGRSGASTATVVLTLFRSGVLMGISTNAVNLIVGTNVVNTTGIDIPNVGGVYMVKMFILNNTTKMQMLTNLYSIQ